MAMSSSLKLLYVMLYFLPIEQYVMGMVARSVLRLRELRLLGNFAIGLGWDLNWWLLPGSARVDGLRRNLRRLWTFSKVGITV